MQGLNSSVETVNAAAAAIISAESRIQPVEAVPRRKWAACFGAHWCFGGPHKNGKRISNAVLVPEPSAQRSVATASDAQSYPPPVLVLPFIAPPSSPVSFLQSEPGSAVHSQDGTPSFSLSANMSPPLSGPASGFTVGPYAHETQLVSPPVFSAFTTEPSTAPFTPPPESVHLTTPSSPEVPYAKLLTSVSANCSNVPAGEVQAYQFDPGSPIGRLISPSSAYSGTSSPYQEPDYRPASRSSFVSFPVCEQPKPAVGEVVSFQKSASRRTREGDSLLSGHIAAAMDHRVSFELNAEDVARRLEKRAAMSGDPADDARSGTSADPAYQDLPEKARRSLSLRLAKEFKFESVKGVNTDPTVGPHWWINEKELEVAATVEPRKSWSFFPMAQP